MVTHTILQRPQALAITTAFAPPAQCTQGHLTMLGREAFYVWLNEPIPVAATVVGDCYPQEFMTSYIDAFRGTTRPAFSPLVCPQNYQTILNQDLGGNSPYIVCCPNNYGFAPPAAANPDRPGYGGTCYSNIVSTTVTKYNNDGYSGLIFFSTPGQAYAHPFDGFAYQGQVAPTAPAPIVPQPGPTGVTQSAAQPVSSPGSVAVSSRAIPVIAVSTVSSEVIPFTTVSSSIVIYSTLSPSVITLYQSISGDGPSITGTTTAGGTDTAASSSSSSSAQTLTGGQIAGVVIGVLTGLVLMAAAFLLLARRRRRKRSSPTSNQKEPVLLDGTAIEYIAEKPKTDTHPSQRQYINEKATYTVDDSPKYMPSSPAPEYHELVSPGSVPQRHELGSHSMRYSEPGSPQYSIVSPNTASRMADTRWSDKMPMSGHNSVKR